MLKLAKSFFPNLSEIFPKLNFLPTLFAIVFSKWLHVPKNMTAIATISRAIFKIYNGVHVTSPGKSVVTCSTIVSEPPKEKEP